jgi:stage V sporulation protein R
VITSEQMMDAYASVGMPVGYHHWSFGKQFCHREELQARPDGPGLRDRHQLQSLHRLPDGGEHADHAGAGDRPRCYGHNSFFKGNYLFRTWTDADAIIDYLLFAANYIAECEERHGEEEVELLLDSCHALMNYGVDRYKRPQKAVAARRRRRASRSARNTCKQVNDLWRTLPSLDAARGGGRDAPFPPEPQENLLYFIEKHAPLLEPWQREIVRIVRKIAQYFYPQRQTQVMNEGWATFWHYTMLNRLYDEGLLTDGFMLEFLQSTPT